jgi:hypothetical protein
VFDPDKHFHLSLIFEIRARAYLSRAPERLLALPTNIRIGWKFVYLLANMKVLYFFVNGEEEEIFSGIDQNFLLGVNQNVNLMKL